MYWVRYAPNGDDDFSRRNTKFWHGLQRQLAKILRPKESQKAYLLYASTKRTILKDFETLTVALTL